MADNENKAAGDTAKAPERDLGTAADITEADLAADMMGNNQLQGNSQENVQNERHAVANVKTEPDASVVESFKMMDKDYRAEAELGKGNRSGKTAGDGGDDA